MMLENKEAVIFDLDGTITDSMWVWADIDRTFFEQRKIPMPPTLNKEIEGMSFTETAEYFIRTFQLPETVEELKDIWNRIALDKYAHETPLKPGAGEILKYLKEHHIKTGIATSNSRLLLDVFLKERDLERLKQMTFYCFTSECLRQYILNYFGEKSSSYCGNCLNCQTQFEEVDITQEAKAILRCLDALDWNYGAATVIDIVHGGKSQKILGKNLDKNPEYAVLSERTVPRLRQILRELQFREYVEEKGEQYPVICLTPEGKAFMKTEEPLIMKLPKEESEKKSESKEKKNRRKKGAVAAELSEKDAELFESLRELRREIASEEKVPPYMVFADKTLAGMCVMRPATRDEMLEVSGVGEHKLKKYGDRFLEILRKG